MSKSVPEKTSVSPAVLTVAAVVVVLFVLFLGWKFFGSLGSSADTATINARIAAKAAKDK